MLTVGVVRGLRVRTEVMLPVLAAAALALYYWLALPGLTNTLGLPTSMLHLLRAGALGFTGFWLVRALRRGRTVRAAPDLGQAVPVQWKAGPLRVEE